MLDPDQVLSVYVAGARGRAADALIRAIAQSENITLAGASDRGDIPGIGQDAGQLAQTTRLDVRVSDTFDPRRGCVVLDFSMPEQVPEHLELCRAHSLPLVLGPATREPALESQLTAAAKVIPIVHANNYSEGLTLLTDLAQKASKVLGPQWDRELLELHHRSKRKSPSSSAQRIGAAMLQPHEEGSSQVLSRGPAKAPRKPGEIGIASLRGGGSVGEHTVLLLGEHERIELTHRAFDRSVFAQGALRAARWVKEQAPGLYDMRDVLGLRAP